MRHPSRAHRRARWTSDRKRRGRSEKRGKRGVAGGVEGGGWRVLRRRHTRQPPGRASAILKTSPTPRAAPQRQLHGFEVERTYTHNLMDTTTDWMRTSTPAIRDLHVVMRIQALGAMGTLVGTCVRHATSELCIRQSALAFLNTSHTLCHFCLVVPGRERFASLYIPSPCNSTSSA